MTKSIKAAVIIIAVIILSACPFSVFAGDEDISSATVNITSDGAVLDGISSYRMAQGKEELSLNRIGDSACWVFSDKTDSSGAPVYVRFLFSEEFMSKATGRMRVDIEYFDSEKGFFELCYVNNKDNVPTDPPAHTGIIQASGSGKWKTGTLYIDDFSTEYSGDDFHIRLGSYTWTRGLTDAPVCIRKITFTHLEPHVVDVELEIKRPGLIYKNGETTRIALSVTNNTDVKQTISISALLKDINGNVISDFSDNDFNIDPKAQKTFRPNVANAEKYGVYTLDVIMKDANGKTVFEESYPFSRIMSYGESLDMVGACMHLAMGRGNYGTNLSIAEQAGIKYWRDDFNWSKVETQTKGELIIPDDWDTWVDYSCEIGMTPLIILNYGNSLYGEVDPNNDEWLQGYVRYCETMVSHFKGRVGAYEIWNEWNIGYGEVAPERQSPECYAKVLFSAAKAINEIDPDATLIAGAISGYDHEWLGKVLSYTDPESGECVYNMIDGISYHPYVYPSDPDSSILISALNDMNTLFDGKDDKQIWITEIGWPTHSGTSGISEEMSGAYLVRMLVNFMSQGKTVDRVFWYDMLNDGVDKSYNENNFGLVRCWTQESVTYSAKANYVALSAMTSILSDTKYSEEAELGDNIIAHTFKKGESNVIVAWCNSSKETLSLVVPNEAIYISDMYGNRQELTVQNQVVTLQLSDYPTYIELGGDEVQTLESAVKLAQTEFEATPGSYIEINISRSQGFDKMSGSYELALPNGWSADKLDFSDGDGNDTIKVTIPQGCNLGNYTLLLKPTCNSDILGEFKLNVKVSSAFSINPVAVRDDDGYGFKLKIDINNKNGLSALEGRIMLQSPTEWFTGATVKEFSVKVGNSQSVFFDLPNNLKDSFYDVHLQAMINGGTAVAITKRVSFLYAMQSTSSMTIDGIINSEWDGAMAFEMDRDNFVSIIGANDLWAGETAKGYAKWDRDNLYIAVEVNDSTHSMLQTNSGIWNGDSLQIAIDPGRESEPAKGNFVEIGFALNSEDDNIYSWQWLSLDGNTDLSGAVFEVKRDDRSNKTIYEASLPWSILLNGKDVSSIGNIGFSVLVNCDNSQGRIGWLEYSSGIGSSKDASLFGDLALTLFSSHVHAMTHHDAEQKSGGKEFFTCSHEDCKDILYADSEGTAILVQKTDTSNITLTATIAVMAVLSVCVVCVIAVRANKNKK